MKSIPLSVELLNSLNGVDLTHPEVIANIRGFYSGWYTASEEVSPSPYPSLLPWANKVLHMEGKRWGEFSQWDLGLLNKGWGTQGTTRPWSLVEPTLNLYFERAHQYMVFPPIPWQMISVVRGLKPLTPEETYAAYKGDHRSNSGVTKWTDRRTPGLALEAYAEACSRTPFDPIVLGQKFEFQKTRTIFMDSFANYFREAPAWIPLAHALRDSGFCPEMAQAEMDHMIHEWMSAHPSGYHALEFDAEMMDSWIDTFKLTHIERFLEDNDVSESYLDVFYRQFALWDIPVITPAGIREGYHSLFSGLLPTHTVENFWTGAAAFDFINRKVKWRRRPTMGKDYLLLVCGDDVSLLLDSTQVLYLPTQEEMAAHWQEWGMLANPQKQRRATSAGTFFCKRFYHHSLDRSVYPLSRAIISFLHPKQGDDLTPCGYNVVRFCAIFDNAEFHPKFIEVLAKMVETFPWLLDTSASDADVNAYNAKVDNWRVKMLGQHFDLKCSTTFQLLKQLRG